MFEAAGPDAAGILKLWWSLLGVAIFVSLMVTFFLLFGYFRSKKKTYQMKERQLTQAVSIATGISALLLIFILIITFKSSQPFKEEKRPALTIEVIGRQWWWSVNYLDDDGSPLLITANEIHIPVGVPILLKLRTLDVIHSFWVPNLAGKMDMIPGRVTELWLQSDKAGIFRGQCAEFCGLQHTLMAFHVIASPMEEFREWFGVQRSPAKVPEDKLSLRGKEVFKEANCTRCHSIRGVYEEHDHAPDLTHFATRKYLAAGTLPNLKGHLAGWITDPQGIKPHNLMPSTPLYSDDLEALLMYLQNLR